MKYLEKMKQPLITAVVVFVALQFLAAVVYPLLPYLLGALGLYVFARIIINRSTKL